MSLSFLFVITCVIFIGAALSLQAPINATLARQIGDPLSAAAISFGIGFVALGALSILRGSGAALLNFGSAPVWALSGGLLGALWVWAAIWSVGKLGVVSMITAMILGQLIAAMAIDAFGAFGVPVQHVTATRVLAIGLVASGLVLSRL